ncbi:hypothetical protein [Mesorhizobium atlanticum]|nr:hypothetical protein [Mesorhizobium atlanticum]
MKKSDQFLQLAQMIGLPTNATDDRLAQQAKDDFGVQRDHIQALMDSANWLVSRPQVEVFPLLNQLGNLVVEWQPVGYESVCYKSQEFEPRFFGRYETSRALGPQYGHRPVSELMYFKEPVAYLRRSGVNSAASFALICGIQARFEELRSEISRSLSVVCESRISAVLRGDEAWIEVSDAT